jgi:hypothetical protein
VIKGDDNTGKMIPVKKLSEAFDNCAKVEGGMKVYLRIRPMPSKGSNESTITVESGKESFFHSYILLMFLMNRYF